MDGNFTVTRGGAEVGLVTLTQKGAKLEVVFRGAPPDSDNIYRLAAVCGGKAVTLGVPVPAEDGNIELMKSFSKTALRDLGFDAPSAFALVLPGETPDKPAPAPPEPEDICVEMPEPIAEEPVAETVAVQEETDGWRPVENPAVMFAENGALTSAGEIAGALLREDGDTVFLAVPISEDAPFPVMSAFCLGEPQEIGGSDYLVFKLKNGVFTA